MGIWAWGHGTMGHRAMGVMAERAGRRGRAGNGWSGREGRSGRSGVEGRRGRRGRAGIRGLRLGMGHERAAMTEQWRPGACPIHDLLDHGAGAMP